MRLDAPGLRERFNECAEINLAWAVDQASCLAQNIHRDSEEAKIVREFCGAAAQWATVEGDVDTTLQALNVVADSQDSEAEKAAQDIKKTLERQMQNSREHALGTALLLKASCRNPFLGEQLLDFLLENCPDNEYGILLNVVTGHTESLNENHVALVIEKTKALSQSKPYEASKIFRRLLEERPDALSEQKAAEITQINDALYEDPEVLLKILKQEHSEELADIKSFQRSNPGRVIPVPPKVLH